MVYVISKEKPEPRNGLNLNDSLNIPGDKAEQTQQLTNLNLA